MSIKVCAFGLLLMPALVMAKWHIEPDPRFGPRIYSNQATGLAASEALPIISRDNLSQLFKSHNHYLALHFLSAAQDAPKDQDLTPKQAYLLALCKDNTLLILDRTHQVLAQHFISNSASQGGSINVLSTGGQDLVIIALEQEGKLRVFSLDLNNFGVGANLIASLPGRLNQAPKLGRMASGLGQDNYWFAVLEEAQNFAFVSLNLNQKTHHLSPLGNKLVKKMLIVDSLGQGISDEAYVFGQHAIWQLQLSARGVEAKLIAREASQHVAASVGFRADGQGIELYLLRLNSNAKSQLLTLSPKGLLTSLQRLELNHHFTALCLRQGALWFFSASGAPKVLFVRSGHWAKDLHLQQSWPLLAPDASVTVQVSNQGIYCFDPTGLKLYALLREGQSSIWSYK